jgi:hypothetical protein
VAGGKYVVETSKSPAYAHLLGHIDNLEVNILHLIRDPRAVAFSWRRKKTRPESGELMLRSEIGYSAVYWLIANGFIDLTLRSNSNLASYHRIRYEDFVSKPNESLNEALAVFNDSPKDVFDAETFRSFKPVHTVSGNPMRFTQGQIEIKEDDEWKGSMCLRDKIIVSLITFPLRYRYGYIP